MRYERAALADQGRPTRPSAARPRTVPGRRPWCPETIVAGACGGCVVRVVVPPAAVISLCSPYPPFSSGRNGEETFPCSLVLFSSRGSLWPSAGLRRPRRRRRRPPLPLPIARVLFSSRQKTLPRLSRQKTLHDLFSPAQRPTDGAAAGRTRLTARSAPARADEHEHKHELQQQQQQQQQQPGPRRRRRACSTRCARALCVSKHSTTHPGSSGRRREPWRPAAAVPSTTARAASAACASRPPLCSVAARSACPAAPRPSCAARALSAARRAPSASACRAAAGPPSRARPHGPR